LSPIAATLTLLLTLACPFCHAQNDESVPSRYAAGLLQPASVDAEIASEVDARKQKFEPLLRQYLVAFNAGHDAENQVHVGLPLTRFAQNMIHVAYDVKERSFMMQWKLAHLTTRGTLWQFQAFLSQSQTASLVVSANF
jgi:hypothetical protein